MVDWVRAEIITHGGLGVGRHHHSWWTGCGLRSSLMVDWVRVEITTHGGLGAG